MRRIGPSEKRRHIEQSGAQHSSADASVRNGLADAPRQSQRGGGGNVHMKKYGGHSSAGEQRADRSETVGDKIKHALGMGHKARHEDGAE